MKCENLNSNEAYIVADKETKVAYVWKGEGASEEEFSAAKDMAK